MPHQCTACGRGFADGSRQMLSGCPDCGGSTFQFLPDGGRVVTSPDGGGAPQAGGALRGAGPGGAATAPAAGDGGPAAGDGGPAAGDGGPAAGDGGPAAGDGGPAAGDGGPAAGDAGPVGRVATTIGDWVAAAGARGEPADATADPTSNGSSPDAADPKSVGAESAASELAAAESPLAEADREAVLVDDSGSEDDAQAAARGSLPGADPLLRDPGPDGVAGGPDATDVTGAPTDVAGAVAADTPTTDTPTTDTAATDPPTDAREEGSNPAASGRAAAGGRVADGGRTADGGPSPAGPAREDGRRSGAAAASPDVEVDVETVCEELDSQFESIRILAPGQYVINLMGLYERDEQVIAVRENGRYVIDVAESRLDGD